MIRIKNRNICMVRNALSILCYVSFYRLNAQFTLTGRLTDKQEQPIEYAEVSIKNINDSTKMMTTLTNKTGNFSLSIPKGVYLLSVNYLGQNLLKKNVSVVGNINIGTLKVNTANQIGEVTVTGKKPLIERKIDRLVFNVENSISASGGDALDALKVTPGIRVQNDEITMIGKSGLSVMVDDRLIRLSGEDLTNYLQSLSAEDIKSIEVITTPPAKYEAEGNSGLINIILKKVKANSWSTSLRSAYQQRTYPMGSGGGSFNFQKKKLTLSSSINYRKGSYAPFETNNIYYPLQTWYDETQRKRLLGILNHRMSLDYKLSDKISTGVQYNGNYNNHKIEENNMVTLTGVNTKVLDSSMITQSFERRKDKLNTLNYHFIYSIDTIGRKLSFDFDYFNYNNDANRIFTTRNYFADGRFIPASFYSANNLGNQKINNYSLNLDMEHPFKRISLNYGGRLSFSKISSNISFYNLTSGTSILDPLRTDSFEYNENIQSLYFSANKSFNRKWEAKLGLRIENTQTKGVSLTSHQPHKNHYVKVFPTAYILYTPNKIHSYNINYGLRINRPSFSWLNPFRRYSSLYFYFEGNPSLRPSFSNNFEFNYNYKDNINFQFYYTHLNNGFQAVSFVDPNNPDLRYTQPVNYVESDTYGVNITYTFDKVKWWTSINMFDLSYSLSTSSIPETNQKLNGNNVYLYSDNTFKVNKNINFNLNYWYGFAGVSELDKNSASSQLNASLRILFFDKNLQFSITGDDLLSSNRPIYTSYTNNVQINYKNYYDYRNIGVSIVYRLGSRKIKRTEREQKNKIEQSRIN